MNDIASETTTHGSRNDREIVDGTVNAIGAGTIDAGRGLRHIQTGRVQNYALGIAIGLIVMAGSYLLLARG